MEVLSKIISMLLTAIFLSLFPLEYQLGHQLHLMNLYLEEETAQFTDEMRDKGYIDIKMYEDFQSKLNRTGELFDIEMEHAISKEGSELKTSIRELPGVMVSAEVLNSLPSPTDSTGNQINLNPKITGISAEPAEIQTERYTEPVIKVMAYYEDGTVKAVTDYTLSGFDNSAIGTQEVTVQYEENSICCSYSITVKVIPMNRICPVCGNEYFLDENDFDRGCPSCRKTVESIAVSPTNLILCRNEPLGIAVTAKYSDGHTEEVNGWESNFIPGISGNQLVEVTYMGNYTYVNVDVMEERICEICGKTYPIHEDGTDPGCPLCSKFLSSISAIPERVTLNQGEDLNLTVKGSYRDGHEEIITGWYSDYEKEKSGEQLVTVYFQNLSCNVTVSVLSEYMTECPVCGKDYNFRENPWGCPVCAETVTGMEAGLWNGISKVLYGKELNLRVVLIYRDHHREMLYDGWTDNFDPYLYGEQKVTICYTDKQNNTVSCSLIVEVMDHQEPVTCENGHSYVPEEEGGACPYCEAQNGEETKRYIELHTTEEILKNLYNKGRYTFQPGDYISIKITLRCKGSIYSFRLFHNKATQGTITAGGEVAGA